jgi:histidine ammonia-lyase
VKVRGRGLTIDDVVAVARHDARVELAPDARAEMAASAALVEGFVAGKQPVYGVTTGFGSLADTVIPPDRSAELQVALVRSHAAGMGDPVERDVVRALLLLRARSLAMARSGARPEIVDLQLALLNHGITPVVREHGSLGASGDLAPLAHCALALIGEGEVTTGTGTEPSAAALARAGLRPLTLRAKEGLALINGTQFMAAIGALVLSRAARLVRIADIAAAQSVEAVRGSRTPFAPEIQALRPHPGQLASAANLYALLDSSEINESHRWCGRVQDAYSLRCSPQVHGACRDAIAYVRSVVAIELNAATDNPLVFADRDEVLSNGNFHGEPVAIALDTLKIALAELAGISERRIERMVNPTMSEGLPPFLAEQGGLNSGFMIPHYVAASLVAENKVLCHPASVDSIPTSAGQEDHVSMGATAAVHAWQVCANVERVLAVELLCGAQGLDFLAPLRPGPGITALHAALRETSPHLGDDRSLSADIETVAGRVRDGALVAAVEGALAPLQ